MLRFLLCPRIVAKLILIAEDDDYDAFAIGRTFTNAGVKNSLERAHDGAGVIDYLKTDGPFVDRTNLDGEIVGLQ